MVVIDEYLAVRVLGGSWPDSLPDDELVLPTSRHWRLLQRVHAPGAGQLSLFLAVLLQVLDPRPLLDDAAAIAAGLAYGRQLWFGSERNVGRALSRIANDLGIRTHVVT